MAYKAPKCGGIKVGTGTMKVLNGVVTDINATALGDAVVTACGQQFDGNYFTIVDKTLTFAGEVTVANTTKANCGLSVDASKFAIEADGAIEYNPDIMGLLTITTSPTDAIILVVDSNDMVVEESAVGVYPVVIGRTYTYTVSKTGYVAYTDDVVISAKDATLDVELVLLSDAKAITAFSFAGLEPAVVGTIDEEAKTIALTVPNGTVVTALVATFINSEKSSVKVGEVAQESGVTANDFTTPVSYVVTAEDETTSTYTVTVTIAEA